MADNTISLKIKLIDDASGAVRGVTANIEGLNDVCKQAVTQTKKMGDGMQESAGRLMRCGSIRASWPCGGRRGSVPRRGVPASGGAWRRVPCVGVGRCRDAA